MPARCSAPQVLSPFPLIPLWSKSLARIKSLGQNQNAYLVGEKPRRRQFKPGSLRVILTTAMLALHAPPGSQACAHVSGPARPPGAGPLARALQGTREGAGMMLLPKLANPDHRKQRPKVSLPHIPGTNQSANSVDKRRRLLT